MLCSTGSSQDLFLHRKFPVVQQTFLLAFITHIHLFWQISVLKNNKKRTKQKQTVLRKKKKATMVRVTSMITLTSVTHKNICCWSQFVKLSTMNAIQKQGLHDLHQCALFKNPHTSYLCPFPTFFSDAVS